MKTREFLSVAIFFAAILIAGCNGSGGGGESTDEIPPPENIVLLSGKVLNNHTDENTTKRAIARASVILVKAGDVAALNSLSPTEDLTNGNAYYPSATTDSHGYYQFISSDFSDSYPADGTYFIFVNPPAADNEYFPGGDASRESIHLNGATALNRDVTLSDTNGPDAAYIGSMFCLFCHSQKNHIKHTLHFVGIRKIGPNGTIVNGLMDMNNTSVYDLSANNGKILDKFTRPATQYTFADDSGKSFWLGKDAVGLYFQMTSDTSPKFYIKYSYGGETGLWRGLFMTTVYAGTGTYAVNHGKNDNDYAYFVMSPIQYNEDPGSVNGGKFVTYHADRWDFAGTANNGFTADPELNSFDLACSICHGAIGIKTENEGVSTRRRVAVFPEEYYGYDIDGIKSNINVGCEKCHGPGSNHFAAGGKGHRIIAPDKLSSGRLTMLCGSCHINGQNYSDIGGGSPLKADGNGNYLPFSPGMTPGQFFGTWDLTGKDIAPFESLEIASLTGNGYFEPVNLEANPEASWMDLRFDADINHSRSHQQHYLDMVRSKKFRNKEELLSCINCHDPHGSPYAHMTIYNADNNAACLSCHHGPGRNFTNISDDLIGRLINQTQSTEDEAVIGKDVEAHIYDKTGTLQMGPYDPEGTAMGRCTLCHMPKTARSADWFNALETRLGQYRHGDISAHTFDVMSTEAVNDMGTARGAEETTPAGITHECGSCHRFSGLN